MNIFLFPAPVLREKSREIREIDGELIAFLESLEKTMYLNKGCVGVAAPQTGVLKRAVITDSSLNKKTKKSSGKLVMINPVILNKEGGSINREGCLSVPDYTGNVERADKIGFEYTDIQGKKRTAEASGFEAVIIQHEIDHLDGVLFVDRIKSVKRDLFRRKTKL
ncbi:MAG: peptide deformylase [Candidatus Goldiibacteriota bacterium]